MTAIIVLLSCAGIDDTGKAKFALIGYFVFIFAPD